MPGFNSLSGDESIMYADNCSFNGTERGGKMTTDGQLWIGATASPHVRVNTLTAGPGISITNGAGTITISSSGGSTNVDSFAMQSGTSPVVPDSNGLVTFSGGTAAAGTSPVITVGGTNVMTLTVQRSQAIAGADATKIGLAAFDSTKFTVDANGFVSTSGTGVANTITGDTGGALSPTAGNWNVIGQTASSIPVMYTSGTGSTLSIEDRTRTTAFVVDASSTAGLRGTYTTIQAAITAAGVGPANIFIRPGTYTENLTLPANINLIGYNGDEYVPQTTIVGKISCTDAGSRCISNIRISSNSDNIIAVSGSVATRIAIENCYLNISGATGLSQTSSSGSAIIDIFDSIIVVTGNIALFTASGGGGIAFYKTLVDSSGWTGTTSTCSAGTVSFSHTTAKLALASSSTGIFRIDYSIINAQAGGNITALTTAGTGSATAVKSHFTSGTASAISIGTGTSVTLTCCSIESSNANFITGAGTLRLTSVDNNNTTGTINPTTLTTYLHQVGTLQVWGNSTISRSNSGGVVLETISNTSNTASSDAELNLVVAGTSAGDSFITYTVTGTTNWSEGLDNSDSDAYVMAASTALGTTNVARCSTAGEWTYPLQPAFLAYNSANDTNQTGNGAAATVDFDTEVYDQNSDFAADTFTAPVTGRYLLHTHVYVANVSSMETWAIDIVTSNRTYRFETSNNIDQNRSISLTTYADMDAADTSTVVLTISGGAGNTATITGSASTSGLIMTSFSGKLVA